MTPTPTPAHGNAKPYTAEEVEVLRRSQMLPPDSTYRHPCDLGPRWLATVDALRGVVEAGRALMDEMVA